MVCGFLLISAINHFERAPQHRPSFLNRSGAHVTSLTFPPNEAAARVIPGEADCHHLHRPRLRAMFLWWCESASMGRWKSSCLSYPPTASPSSNTHTHFNTSSSIFCTPPQQDQIGWPPVAHHYPIHSLMLHYLNTARRRGFAKVGIN